MAIWRDKILKVSDDLLSKPSREVEDVNSKKITDLKERLMLVFEKYPKVQGLSAVQIGVLERIAILRIKGEVFYIINPKIVKSFFSQKSIESCASVDSKPFHYDYYTVRRPLFGKVEYIDENGKRVSKWVGKKYIRLYAHEIDHMDGITIDNKGEFKICVEVH